MISHPAWNASHFWVRRWKQGAIKIIATFVLLPSLSLTSQTVREQLIGTWQGNRGTKPYKLVLNADQSGSLNGIPVQWKLAGQGLTMVTEKGAYSYKVSATSSVLTLSGLDLKEPLALRRVGAAAEPTGLFSEGSDATAFPVPGNPPLTRHMVKRGADFFEWLLDAKLTAEQHKEFRQSLVDDWKSGKQDDIDGTVNVLKFADQLDQKTPQEREAYRQVLQAKLLEQMRAQPQNTLSQWVLNIYDSAHKAIAAGNPPLTQQTVDAYAEIISFMARQSLGNRAFTADRQFKNILRQALVARYSQLGAAQQAALAKIPMVWALVQAKWPSTPESEKQAARKEWRAELEAMLSTSNQNQAPAASANSGGQDSSESLDAMIKKEREHVWVNSMCQSSMNSISNSIMNRYR